MWEQDLMLLLVCDNTTTLQRLQTTCPNNNQRQTATGNGARTLVIKRQQSPVLNLIHHLTFEHSQHPQPRWLKRTQELLEERR